jgi:hypothetical protein
MTDPMTSTTQSPAEEDNRREELSSRDPRGACSGARPTLAWRPRAVCLVVTGVTWVVLASMACARDDGDDKGNAEGAPRVGLRRPVLRSAGRGTGRYVRS